MQTTFIRFSSENYVPNVIVNLIEKLEDLYGVQEVVRPVPCGIMVTVKNRRLMKRMLHEISPEMRAMQMHVIVPPKSKRDHYR